MLYEEWATSLARQVNARLAPSETWLGRRAAGDGARSAPGAARRFSWPSLAEQREQRIREAAYLRAERRGFAPGHELEDWLDAEQEVDRASRPLPWT